LRIERLNTNHFTITKITDRHTATTPLPNKGDMLAAFTTPNSSNTAAITKGEYKYVSGER